ncbi:MAG: amino acid transporter, partial [Chitinophagia bacterium]|nr:amino acid transporter [Chitinophagia bacterium]
MSQPQTSLSRNISVTGLVATGISSMIGASIYIVPFMLQKNVPGIGPYILPAF